MEGNKIKFILINFIYIIVTIFVLISCKDGSSGSSSNSSEKNGDSSSGPVYDNNPLSTLNEGLALEIVTYLFDALESSDLIEPQETQKESISQVDKLIK